MVPKTKIRILQTALRLYNDHGVYSPHGELVTARRIAAALRMSDGNLRYHFPTKEDIIRGLYDQLAEKLSRTLESMNVDRVDLVSWLAGFQQSYEWMYAYRFLLRDFVAIMQHQTELRLHFQLLQSSRKEMFGRMLQALNQESYLREEPLPDQYNDLLHQMQILWDGWIVGSELWNHGDPQGGKTDKSTQVARLTLSLLVPYLSEHGLNQWKMQMPAESSALLRPEER